MRQASDTTEVAAGAFPVQPMLILCAAQIIFVAAFQMVGIAMPDIQEDLVGGDPALQWVNSALALAALILPAPLHRISPARTGALFRPALAQNRAERTNAGRPVRHLAR